MFQTMAADNIRLNYTISDKIDELLNDYCELTGRSASDLVRQLIYEVLEEDRILPPPSMVAAFAKSGERRDRRTDMWMSSSSLTAFDERLEGAGYPSKSAVIAYLLSDFLSSRANHAVEEMVRVTTLIDRVTYTKLKALATNNHQQIEELISIICRDFIQTTQTTDSQSAKEKV